MRNAAISRTVRDLPALLTRDSGIELSRREALPKPRTFDPDNLTIEAVVASATPVRRRDQRGEYLEILDPAGLDLAGARGVSVIDAHRRDGIGNVLGTIDDAWREGNEVAARIRLSTRPEIAAVVGDIRSGIISNLSIGYEVAEWREGKAADGTRTRTATKWSIREVSFVPVPADPTARTRSLDPPTLTDRAAENRAIRELARRAGMPSTVTDDLIDRGATIDQARAAIMFEMLDRSVIVRSGRDHNAMSLDTPEAFVRAAGEALYARVAPQTNPSEPARQFIGLTIPEIAREVLRRQGVATTAMGTSALIERALNTTSDFPLILADTIGRTMRVAYAAAPSGIRQLARESTAADFRKKSRLQLDASGFTLERVNEHGEFRSGSMAEAAESYAVDSYGKIFGITRKALVNDDVGAFSDLSRRVGQAAASFEAAFLVNLLVANAGLGPVMSDTKKLFDADHGNVGTAGPPSETTLSEARLLMRRQTGPGGGLISVIPRYLLAPPDMETACEKLLTEIQATVTDDVNPFSRLSLVIEPRLIDAARWYLVGDPAQIDGLEFAYLAGAPGPQIESRAGFEVDGVQIKVRLDYGAGFVDHRGWTTNAGQ
ncbi:prohead protease/major capsid protein fusion protein [Bradyrhizobium cenepequi]